MKKATNYLTIAVFFLLKKNCLIIIISLLATTIQAQILFENSYSNFSEARKVSETTDGGYIISGTSNALGNDDMAMIKLDISGNVEWSHAYGNGLANDYAEAVTQTLDGGYLLVGGSDNESFYVKTDSNGAVEWQKFYNLNNVRYATGVIALSDTTYIISGGGAENFSDAGLTKIDKNGNVLWTYNIPTQSYTCCSYYPQFYNVMELDNGKILAMGSRFNGNSGSSYVLLVNPNGSIVWEKYISGSIRFYNGTQIASGDIVLTGRGSGTTYGTLTKIDTSGNVIWAREYESTITSSYWPSPQAVAETATGDLLIIGHSYDGKTILFKANNLGQIQGTKEFNNLFFSGDGNQEEQMSLISTSDGAFLFAMENSVKKVTATVDSICDVSDVSYQNNTLTPNPTNITLSKNNDVAADSKTFIDGNINSVKTVVCSAYNCSNSSTDVITACDTYTWIDNNTYTSSNNTATHILTNATGCDSVVSLDLTINLSPVQPTAISGNTTICSGVTETYSVSNDANATSYTWTLPTGWSGSSTTNSITATAGTSGGTISVTANNACGSSTTQILNVTVNTVPTQPSTMSGNATLCEGDTETYSVTNDPNATSYTWTLPSGWSGTSTTNSITATAGSAGGTIEVTAENSCGVSSSQTLSVTVNGLPSVVASGTASICEGDATPLSASGASTYNWSNGAGTGSSVSVAPTTNTTYTVTGTDGNGCENTDDVTITVNSLPTVTASGTATICEGESTSISASGANNYSWSNGAGTGSSVSVTPTTNTTYTVTGTDGNGCENTDDVTITVNPLPTVTASADETICEGESTSISASGANNYSWSNGAGTGSSVSVAPTTNTTYTVTGTDANGCENTDEVTISIQNVPDNGVTLESDQVTITANSTGIDYTWVDCDNNFQAIQGETNQSFTAVSNGSYAVIVSNQGCADTSDCVVIDKVSLTSNTLNPNISLVPNPISSITKIVTDVQINKVQVVDFSGKIIEVPHNKSENELDFSNLPVGTYFIQIQTLNGSYVERVVVM